MGRLVLGEKIVSDGMSLYCLSLVTEASANVFLIDSTDWEATEDFHPDDTDVLSDFQRSEFLDLSKALIPQMWYGDFSKEFYLEQVHQPRHVTYSAKMFPYPWLEVSSVCDCVCDCFCSVTELLFTMFVVLHSNPVVCCAFPLASHRLRFLLSRYRSSVTSNGRLYS